MKIDTSKTEVIAIGKENKSVSIEINYEEVEVNVFKYLEECYYIRKKIWKMKSMAEYLKPYTEP